VTVIEKYRHGLFEPSSGKDEINKMVSVIDVYGLDQQTASWRNNLNRLPLGTAELELNPISGSAGDVAWFRLNARQIRSTVSVKIRNRKLCTQSRRSNRCILNICGGRRTETSEAKP
jgi:hypothetical protein